MKTKSKLSSMLQCSLFAALLCVLSPLTIPVGAVPVSLGIFAVLLCSSVLGMRRSLVAVLVYIALGAVGLPVFAGWQGGFGVLAGPTGGVYMVIYSRMRYNRQMQRYVCRRIVTCHMGCCCSVCMLCLRGIAVYGGKRCFYLHCFGGLRISFCNI